MAHFGNCDPETADQEYCIFHKPNKTEEEAREFWEKFLERFKPKVEKIELIDWDTQLFKLAFNKKLNCKGFVFPDFPRNGVQYINTQIDNFPFRYAEFKNHVSFDSAIFEGTVDFSYATFEMGASFEYSKFEEISYFPFVKFKLGANFFHSVFKKDVTFERSIFAFKIRLEFKEDLYINFRYAIFEGETSFYNVFFEEHVDFSGAQFYNTVHFSNSQFNGWLRLDGVNFNDSVYFDDCNFSGEVAVINNTIFSKNVVFSGSKFKGDIVNFDSVTFKGSAMFVECSFQKPVYFGNIIFSEGAEFTGSLFEEPVVMLDVQFLKKASFEEVTFKGHVTFGEVGTYQPVPCIGCENEVSIDDDNPVVFEDIADFSASLFEGYVEFEGVIFKGDASFEGVSFNEPVSFRGKPKAFEHKFYGILDFSHADIRKGIDIDIPSDWFKLPEAELEARRVQRLSYEKEGKRDEADRMFVLERRAYRKFLRNRARDRYSKAKTYYQKFEAVLFLMYAYVSTAIETVLADWVSLYGTSWGRIILSSCWVITTNAILYWSLSQFSSVNVSGIPIGTIYTNGASQGIPGFLNALYYSLVTFTTLGYGDMHPTGWLKALSALEAFTGAVFMALIVAVIARKWMR